ncbi:MAG: glycosyltransferase family 9 protein [Candidatus Rifleibacteriota bacterium]
MPVKEQSISSGKWKFYPDIMPDTQIIIRLNAMGDILLTVPVLNELKRRGRNTVFVIHQRWQELAPFLPAKIRFYRDSQNLLQLIRQLNHLKPSILNDLQGKAASIIIKHLVKAKHKTSFYKRSCKEQYDVIAGKYPIRLADTRPVWKRYADACDLDGLENPDPDILIPAQYADTSLKLIKDNGLSPNNYYLIHVDASKPGKKLPQTLVDQICKITDKPLVAIGTGKNLSPMSTEIIDLRNCFALGQLPGILFHSAGIISSDSGPMHMARSVNIPTIGIFIQTDPGLGFSPVPGPKNLIISKNLPCKPCSLHGQRAECPEGHFACRKLPLEETAHKVLTFLQRWS